MLSQKRRRRVRASWTALLTALVLLVQGAAPAMAMPRAEGGSVVLEMCTHDGLKRVVVPLDQPAGGDQVHHDCCDHCVMAVAVVLPLAAPAVPLRYAAAEQIALGAPVTPSARSRAPPRPPSQGPPLTV